MPYPTKKSLPDEVKNNLPSEAQEIWRNAFNSAFKQYPGDEEKSNKIAWGAVKNAGWIKEGDKWIKKKSQAATHEFDAEIFSAGTWNGDNYTEADLDDMVKNFDLLKGEIKPPVKLGHNEKQIQDGQPALGWVSRVKRVGSKLIATLSDVPDIVHRALQSGRYKRVSSEIYWNYKSGESMFKRVLAGVALLGADIPAVTNLEDLEAFLNQSTGMGSFDKIAAYSFNVDTLGKINSEEDKMSEDIKKQYEADLKAAKNEKEMAEKEAKGYKEQLDTIKKTEAENARKTEAENLKSFCEKMVEAGKMTPAGRDIILEDGKHLFTDDGKIIIDAERFQKYVETHGKVLDVSEIGNKGGKKDEKEYATADEELAGKAQKYSIEKKCDYATAIQAVLVEDKELADRYIGEKEE